MHCSTWIAFIAGCLCGAVSTTAKPSPDTAPARCVPILYSTDLFHPHDDPDDHFDLATLFAIPEFDIRGIILEQGIVQAERPGAVPLKQIMQNTGRTVPFAVGLGAKLKSVDDKATDQPAAMQGGVDLLLKTLRESKEPVTVFTAGSLRDVAAALNRDPALLRAKVARLYVNAGHSGGEQEWNVRLDPHAYVRVMSSPLPVYWVPCFGPEEHASFWRFRHDEVLDAASPALQNYFLYALTKMPPAKLDPIQALSGGLDPTTRTAIWKLDRNMWCTAAFLHAAGRDVVRRPGHGWVSVRPAPVPTAPTEATAAATATSPAPGRVFGFERHRVRLQPDGITRLAPNSQGPDLLTFYRIPGRDYADAMRGALRDLLNSLRP